LLTVLYGLGFNLFTIYQPYIDMANEKMKGYQTDHDAWKKALPDATPELSPTAVHLVAGENLSLTKSGEPKKKPGPKPKSSEVPKPVRSPPA
jgi:hypothetical protein